MNLRDEAREMAQGPGKFGGDKFAAFLYLLSLEGGADEETGSVEWDVWVARMGRFLLTEDDRGFVYCGRYASVEEAKRLFAAFDEDYSRWED